ncbi:hypothetical protein [Subtercola endophyticus]|uniref:hypothetical protein n=1 Tax=Subtercola endophyticus TaxID=2895559 RepID=UPI001E2F0AE3|nr:hypothetical protein [Subtercola endophyticus]UFS60870.1 hypothetical protein LQ955_09100 [Subtercola endophyticus]
MSTAVAPAGVLGLEQRRAALRAGSLGCLIVSGGMIVDGVVVTIIAFALGFLDALSGLSTGDAAPEASHAATAIAIATVLSIGGLIGVGLVTIGLVVSHGILVRSFVHRPRSVLWAGFGISSIPTAFFALIFLAGHLVTSAGQPPGQGSGTAIVSISFAAVFGLIDAVITPLIAGYAFLWMAHVFRAKGTHSVSGRSR